MMDSVNYYGSLCTEMYVLLHSQAPQDELAFYLSYAHPGDRVLELLCGSGRFLVPFVQRGFDITGVDWSQEMLEKMNAYWRAANYLSAGQLYLLDNPLLKKPLSMDQIKKKIVGHWGTVPGQNFVYVHLNRAIKRYDGHDSSFRPGTRRKLPDRQHLPGRKLQRGIP